MPVYRMAQLTADRRGAGRAYLEFLRTGSLSAGVYELPAGGTDPQQPHGEEELYYVVRGRARVRVGDDDEPVEAGAVVFVGAGVPHHFHDIAEDLTLLVFFAPAEGTAAAGRAGDGG